jgi:uncharacterized membrane protein
MIFFSHSAHEIAYILPHFSFPEGMAANEEFALRWIHFVAGILWIGLLYFFNLIFGPAMKQLEGSGRARAFHALMSRAMWWFRWSGLITVLAGLRYFIIILKEDAANSGKPSLAWHWLGEWFLTWLVAYALIYVLQLPSEGTLGNGWVRAMPIAAVVIAASWVALDLNGGPMSSNGHLAISVGGGLGLVMLLNAWGVVWRVQKRLIEWNRLHAEQGTPLPAEAARLMRWAFLASRTAFWISFPMLFFMGAADHYPFLSSIVD